MELYIDIEKSWFNRGKLVRRPVQVHGKNGKVFTRMQWVDPRSGQPVMETHGGEHDHEKNMLQNLSPGDKGRLAHRFLTRDSDRARLFVKHTGGDHKAPTEDLTNHVASNLTDVPFDHLKPHMEGLGQNKPTKVGLQHTDHGLTPEEVNKRTGKDGGLNLDKLSEGDMPYTHKDFKSYFEDDVDAKSDYHRTFGDTTIQGLESVFSHPEGEFNAMLHDLIYHTDSKTGKTNWELTFGLFEKDNYQKYKAETKGMTRYRAEMAGAKYRMGSIYRTIGVDDEGELHVMNDEFTLDNEHHGKGVGAVIYNQSEQYWKHISKGYPVNITLKANISIGTYAWAKKGFDFAEPKDLDRAHNLFRLFCQKQGFNPQDVAKENGFNKASEIKHAWEFATLKYKQDNYDLKSLVNSEYEDEVKGVGHFGKAFMMGGLVSWSGKKVLNKDDITEQVSDINERYSKKAKQE